MVVGSCSVKNYKENNKTAQRPTREMEEQKKMKRRLKTSKAEQNGD